MTNLVILVGRIARDPETRTTQGGTGITSISVVTDRPARKDGKTYKDENGYTAKDREFHRIPCFTGLGQNVAKYCTKGQMVSVEGRIHYTQWEDESGTKRYGDIPLDSYDDQFIYAYDSSGRTNVCFGDSGGPSFVDGKLVTVTSYGYTDNCRYLGGYQRVDIPVVQDWLSKVGAL